MAITGNWATLHSWKGHPRGDSEISWIDLGSGGIDGQDWGGPRERDLLIGSIETSISIAYNEVNKDISTNPILVFHLKVICKSTNQLSNPIFIKHKSITGKEANLFLQVQNWASALSNNQKIVDIPLPEGLYLDNESYLEYILNPEEIVTLTFYYKEVAKIIATNPDLEISGLNTPRN